MGRQQVQPSLRQAVQQQTANPKLQHQPKQTRPTSGQSNSVPTNGNNINRRPQSPVAQSLQSKQPVKANSSAPVQSRQPQQKVNPQVYLPTPVKEHPDDAFFSGAWLFDQSRIPQWMSAQLPPVTQQRPKQQQPQQRPNVRPASPPSKQQSQTMTGGSKAKPSAAANKSHYPNAQVYLPTPVKEHVDDAFYSGAWLFDESRIPQWMATQLPKQQPKQQHVARPLLVQQRPISPTIASQKQQSAKPVVQQQSQQQRQMKQANQRPLPTMQHGDESFLRDGWSQGSRQPLWSTQFGNAKVMATTSSSQNARPQSPSLPVKQSQQQQQNQKRPQSPRRR